MSQLLRSSSHFGSLDSNSRSAIKTPNLNISLDEMFRRNKERGLRVPDSLKKPLFGQIDNDKVLMFRPGYSEGDGIYILKHLCKTLSIGSVYGDAYPIKMNNVSLVNSNGLKEGWHQASTYIGPCFKGVRMSIGLELLMLLHYYHELKACLDSVPYILLDGIEYSLNGDGVKDCILQLLKNRKTGALCFGIVSKQEQKRDFYFSIEELKAI